MILVAHFRTSLHQRLLSKAAADWKTFRPFKRSFWAATAAYQKDLFDSLSFPESEQQNTCKRPISCETDLQVYWDKAFCGPRQYTLKAIMISKRPSLKQGIDFSYHNSNDEERNPEHYNIDPMSTTSGSTMIERITWSSSFTTISLPEKPQFDDTSPKRHPQAKLWIQPLQYLP